MLTRTWFHTGAFLEAETVSKIYAGEFWNEPALSTPAHAADLAAMTIPDTDIPPISTPMRCRRLIAR